MNARLHDDDRGLAAVRRVRVARENDSRIGLQHALGDRRTTAAAAARAQERLVTAAPFGTGGAAQFHLHRQVLTALADDRRSTADAAAVSDRVADEARRRWVADRTSVRVADLLLERRAEARAAERLRRETADLDDLAAAGWLRRATAETGAGA